MSDREWERGLHSLRSDSLADAHPLPGGKVLADTTPPEVDTTAKTENVVLKVKEEVCVTPDKLAYQVGPVSGDPVHYSNSLNSLRAAIKRRYCDLQKKFAPDAAHSARIKKTVASFIKEVLPPQKIREWREKAENEPFRDICSKKWSTATFENAVSGLQSRGTDVNVRFKASIKSEVLQFKPAKDHRPRIVVDCGTETQLCCKAVCKCIEDLTVKHFHRQTIKHKPKYDAVFNVASRIRPDDRVFEGDGSAWDATVSFALKQEVENQIMRHVASVLFESGDTIEGLQAWFEAEMATRESDTTKIAFSRGGAMAEFIIQAMRISGDGLTSIGNFIVNLVLWCATILADPSEFIRKPKRVVFEAVGGGNVRFVVCFEGDDSIIITTTKLTLEEIEKIWDSFGFNMKIFERKQGDRTVFVGMEFVRGQPATLVPEVARGVANSAWSLSDPGTTPSSRSTWMREVATSFYARAEMSRHSEMLGTYYRSLAFSWATLAGLKGGEETDLSADDQYKLFGDHQAGRKIDLMSKICSLEIDDLARPSVVKCFRSEADYLHALSLVRCYSGGAPVLGHVDDILPGIIL